MPHPPYAAAAPHPGPASLNRTATCTCNSRLHIIISKHADTMSMPCHDGVCTLSVVYKHGHTAGVTQRVMFSLTESLTLILGILLLKALPMLV
jgi:hypothetical protein